MAEAGEAGAFVAVNGNGVRVGGSGVRVGTNVGSPGESSAAVGKPLASVLAGVLVLTFTPPPCAVAVARTGV